MTPLHSANGQQISDSSLPPGTPEWVSAELLALTIRTWQPYYSEPLTPEEAIAIIRNVGRLMDVLTRETG